LGNHYAGVAQDDQGNSVIGCEAIEETGSSGDVLHVVEKRDSDTLTGEGCVNLGVGMSGRGYKHVADEKYGRRHRVMF
jgi:hypothetical protein